MSPHPLQIGIRPVFVKQKPDRNGSLPNEGPPEPPAISPGTEINRACQLPHLTAIC